jgi:hypothetical protein
MLLSDRWDGIWAVLGFMQQQAGCCWFSAMSVRLPKKRVKTTFHHLRYDSHVCSLDLRHVHDACRIISVPNDMSMVQYTCCRIECVLVTQSAACKECKKHMMVAFEFRQQHSRLVSSCTCTCNLMRYEDRAQNSIF